MYSTNGSASSSYISHHPHPHLHHVMSSPTSSALKDGFRDKMLPQSPYDHPPSHHQPLPPYHSYAPSAAAAAAASMDYGSRFGSMPGNMTTFSAAAAMTSPLSAAMASTPFFSAAAGYPSAPAPMNYVGGSSDLMTSPNQHYVTLSTSSRKATASSSTSSASSMTSLSGPPPALSLWPTGGSGSIVGGVHVDQMHDVIGSSKMASPSARCGVGSAFGPFYGDKMASVWNSSAHLGDAFALSGLHGLQGGSCHLSPVIWSQYICARASNLTHVYIFACRLNIISIIM